MYVGMYDRKPVKIIRGNQKNIVLTGIPGSGKTCRMQKIELETVKEGGTAIVVDVTPAHTVDRILRHISPDYEKVTNRIDAVKDGLDVQFLTSNTNSMGEEESDYRVINSVVNAIKTNRNGSRQIGVLRDSITEAKQYKNLFPTMCDIEILKNVLEKNKKHNNPVTDSVYNQLWPLFQANVFRHGNKCILKGKINIINFSGLDINTATVCAEVFLSTFWRNAY